MNWPLASDYQDAVQNPMQCFQDLQLKAGHVALNRIGLPRVASGMFASVYEIRNGEQRWAVRCFLRPSADQRERYALLSKRLGEVHIPELVGFAYEVQGIRVRGQWYPIVKMDWVEGVSLHTYISKHLQEPDTLRSLARQWRLLMQHLRQNSIAHADLQHGNVMVTAKGELRLVDYDGMFVETLDKKPSHELGHPNYQHPNRTALSYDEKLDNFSALVIYTSLAALIYDSGLWGKFHTGENLIFSEVDFKAPLKSKVFEQLYRSAEPVVRELSKKLDEACVGKITNVPDFAETVARPMPKPWWDSSDDSKSPQKMIPQEPIYAALEKTPLKSENMGRPPVNPNAAAPARSSTPTPEGTRPTTTPNAQHPIPHVPAHPTSSPPEDADDWWKRNQEALQQTPAGKAVTGFLQPLKKLWDEAGTPVPNPPANVPARSPIPVPLERGVPRSVSKKRAEPRWVNCASVMCLFLCLAFFAFSVLAQAFAHTLGQALTR